MQSNNFSRECRNCKKPFIPRTHNQEYCNSECAITGQNKKQQVERNASGYYSKYNASKPKTKTTVCKHCGEIYKRDTNKTSVCNKCSKIRTPIISICLNCTEQIIDKNYKVFCSSKCESQYAQSADKEIKHKNWEKLRKALVNVHSKELLHLVKNSSSYI